MKYLVIDELCNEEREYYDLKEAKKDALNVQGILLKVNPDGEKETICDYSEF